MSLTIRIPDEAAKALEAKARAQGITAEEYALQLLNLDLTPEWLRRSWDTAKVAGLDQLSEAEIEAEIASARRTRRETRS